MTKDQTLPVSSEMSVTRRMLAVVDPTPFATEPLRDLAAKNLGECLAMETLAKIEKAMDESMFEGPLAPTAPLNTNVTQRHAPSSRRR